MSSTSSIASTSKRRSFEGRVVSIAGASTAVVQIDRRVAHPKYGKYHTLSKKFLIDDPKGAAKLGDVVAFEECRPLSRHKRWRYVSTVRATETTTL